MRAIGDGTRRTFFGAVSSGVAGLFAGGFAGKSTKPHRRVVTGTDSSGHSAVVSDGPVPPEDGAVLWFLRQVPADLTDSRDPIASPSGEFFPPPPSGVTAMIFTWQPGFAFPMHRTPTVDFIIVVSGRLELLLESGNTIVGAGDCVVQRGTRHGWRVVGNEPCIVAGIVVGANG